MGAPDPPVDRCPFCEDEGRDTTGRYDGRILIGGRGIWRCPIDPEHKWQDANEKPSSGGKDFHLRPRSS